jgi:asparagine synthase (glutamine-hydrolysing)
MCGIAGVVGFATPDILRKMSAAIEHRGPDAEGIVSLRDNSLHFIHRRLSILDLSVNGAQPMSSHNGRWLVILNGEIYNFKELRKELSRNWKGTSDTEVLTEAVAEWGLVATLKKIVGMFAIAAYDKESDALFLARDRMGEKPLYYGHGKNGFIFSSELKPIKVNPTFEKVIDRKALRNYFAFNYIPAPQTIYENISKLEPGHYLEIKLSDMTIKKNSYWTLPGSPQTFEGSYQEALASLENMLNRTIHDQMISDVPLGAFLSGGIDSSTVVALMQKNSSQKVKTFTIGFHTKEYNEAAFAKEVARHLGTEHTEVYVSPEDVLNVIPKIPHIYDEPFSDSSQIPTYLVSEITRKHVTVALSGDAGDEVFAGYNRYLLGPRIAKIPPFLRKGMSAMVTGTPEVFLKRAGVKGDKKQKLLQSLRSVNKQQIYNSFTTHWGEEENIVLNEREISYPELRDDLNFEMAMNWADFHSYLPDDILVKVDRAAMAVGLETRVPFLDHRIIEFAWSLPFDFKVHNGKGKRILKDVLYKHLPTNMFQRPKTGFAIPLEYWLRKELKDWAHALLDPEKIKTQGLNNNLIQERWQEHQAGKANWHYQLWDVLMYMAWLEAESV